MQQLTQKLKDGRMQVVEVPLPGLAGGQVLVRNHYSLISAGTEGGTVRAARKGYLGKARERPEQVQQVMDTLRSQGPRQTYRAVMKKLEQYSQLGYSCVGEVIDVGPAVAGLRRGDLVACGGLSACHAEVVAVPGNLCVRLDAGADLRQAVYNTLGAIALQAVRQADLHLGETGAVIGLGVLGQLVSILWRASGVRVVGIDIDRAMVDMARAVDLALVRDDAGIEERIRTYSDGIGCDGVIIAAATDSLDPINFAGAIARRKGRIVILGAVPTGFDREPDYYRKELEVRMSCSYGPGRYDMNYEEHGIDYPPAYVRWTERRNMQAFQELIRSGTIDVGYLNTHKFKLQDSPAAYELLLGGGTSFCGILIEYDTDKELQDKGLILNPAGRCAPATVSVGFIGAGSYAQGHLLPNLPADIDRQGVLTRTGSTGRSVAERFDFSFCTTREEEILDNPAINTVFIATRHDTHARFVIAALRAGKHVFVEKPLCLTPEELSAIEDVLGAAPLLMVGYNRRFAPLTARVREICGKGPLSMVYRINAGAIAPDAWVQDPQVGGGRILGEVCHFVDYLTHLCGALPVRVHADAMADGRGDTLQAALSFADGSIGTIAYFANGDRRLPKEHIEIFAHGQAVVVDDFKGMSVYAGGKQRHKRGVVQDKGQRATVRAFFEAVRNGKGVLIPYEEIVQTSRVSFGIMESLATGETVTF